MAGPLPLKPVLAPDETSYGLDVYCLRAHLLTAVGITLACLVAVLITTGAAPATPEPVGYALVSLGLGAGALRAARRMRRVLRSFPWQVCRAVTVRGRLGAPVVVLTDPGSGLLLPFSVATTRNRFQAADPGPEAVLWFCGDFVRGGVVSLPGGDALVWVRPLRGRAARRAVGRAGR
ncbi:hypothetical protein ACIO3O_28845 [Streptomyces sp. NPDC087440]|uniref:hypothetical protein n=1 Tax=Streptomyces sp. NPDC087440 TaxID=3365790 RepID=UPI00380FE66D